MQRDQVGASLTQRQWIGLSSSGDEVTLQPLPSQFSRNYLQTIDLEVAFLKRGHEIAEQFSTDEMASTFLRGHKEKIFGVGESLIFEFHGQNLRILVKSFSVVDLPGGGAGATMGILMEKTDITLVKAADSLIKLRGSSKK